MKKVIYALLMAICAIFILTSCETTANSISDTASAVEMPEVRENVPSMYYPDIFYYEEGEDSGVYEFSTSSEPNDYIYELANSVFAKVNKYYGIEKSAPNIKIVPNEEFDMLTGGVEIFATYKSEDKTIYIKKSFSRRYVAVLAHEYLHYLSDNGDKQGLKYNNENALLAKAFNEGATNYLTIQVFNYPDDTCVYEFETHVAELFATSIGEEKFAKAYFESDIQTLKTEFNQKTQETYPVEEMNGYNFDQFDVLVATLDSYELWLNELGYTGNTVYIEPTMRAVNSVEQTMLYFANQSGKKDEALQIMRKFLKDEYQISWSYYSKIPELAEMPIE